MRTALILATLSLALPALADEELTPEKSAKIERDKTKAMDEVDKKHGNKKSSELTSEERKEVIGERAAAERAVFEKNGVTAKGYTAYTSKMNKDDRAATKAADAKLEAKEKADAAAAAEKAKNGDGPKEVQVQHGFSDSNPVVLEEKQGGAPTVEKGLPQDYQDEQSSAAALNEGPAAPAAGKGKKK